MGYGQTALFAISQSQLPQFGWLLFICSERKLSIPRKFQDTFLDALGIICTLSKTVKFSSIQSSEFSIQLI